MTKKFPIKEIKLFLIFILIATFLSPIAAYTQTVPLVLGHRGACGYRPEHTLASYQLAIDMGADYIEPDLVITKDGVLIIRHENEMSGTTDVAEKFPKRIDTKTIDGKKITGWFTEDFTLKELKTLRAKERLVFRNHSYDGLFEIPTFKEFLDLVKKQSIIKKRVIGIYPETKHPSYFQSIGFPLEEPLIKILTEEGFNKVDSLVFIQSFELENIKKLKKMTKLPLIYLLDDPEIVPYDNILKKDPRTYKDMLSEKSLKEISEVAYGIGPFKRYIVPENAKGELLSPTTLIKDAHAFGLKVHPFTFRNEDKYLNKIYQNDPLKEYIQFFELGVDAVFSDFSDVAVAARKIFLNKQKSSLGH